ncbi:carbohydrate-binding module family 48 protein [Gracilaria domingensis]|nr:carbohydrate-binding module family 48 protein [Gracilaria domingensis]
MVKSAAKPAKATTKAANNATVSAAPKHNGTATPKKRVDKVVTAKPVPNDAKSSPKVDLKPAKAVKDTIKNIDDQIAKENSANQINTPSTQPQQAKPADKPLESQPAPQPLAQVSPEKNVTLEWTPHMGSSVFVTGSFADWKEQRPVVTDDGSYKVTLALPPGKHLYKFVVDGQWFYDITQPTEADSEGNVNNIVTV